MCGIVGYIGPKNLTTILLNGLKRLEYRGYDSAGLALSNGNKIEYLKTKGRIADLEAKLKKYSLKGNLGLSHTRWSTHGEPSEINSHPHYDCRQNIFLVHNGIIENHVCLKKWLEKQGHKFVSETDTEILPHLIEEYCNGDLVSAVQKALSLVEGTYGIALISKDEPDKLIAVRSGSPLVIGICAEGEYIVASDPAAIIEHTKKAIYLDDGEIAVLTRKGMKIITLANSEVKKQTQEIKWSLEKIEKAGFSHFMKKEIFEQPQTIKDALRGRCLVEEGTAKLGGLTEEITLFKEGRPCTFRADDILTRAQKIIITGCGTSWHAGLVGKYLLENLANIPVEVDYASELRYRNLIASPRAVMLVISQSGETADTLAVFRKAKKKGMVVLGICNMVGSTIARQTDAGVYLHAGPEIGVASTKAFTSQMTVLVLMTLLLGRKKASLKDEEAKCLAEALIQIPSQVEEILKASDEIKKIADDFYQFDNFLYLGRSYNFPVALEGALKLKEISYIHAEGYPAAEIKHGPIALIDKNMPVVVIATDTEDVTYQKVISNIEEIKARKGQIIALASQGNKDIAKLADRVIEVPKTKDALSPLLNVIPFQLLAYYMAVLRGCDVDKPRNLAKSVTVE